MWVEQMFESEMQRKIKTAALAPVPQRQPIGDSFFPRASKTTTSAAGEEEAEEDVLEPVDIVSRLWRL